MRAKVGRTPAPISNGTTAPATSGPSAGKAFGAGSGPAPAKAGGARFPNSNLKATTVAVPNGTDAQNNNHPNQ